MAVRGRARRVAVAVVAACEEAPRPRPWPAIVSIAAAGLYVATAVVGLLSAQTPGQVVAELVAVVIGLITIVVAVRMGPRYPHWGGRSPGSASWASR